MEKLISLWRQHCGIWVQVHTTTNLRDTNNRRHTEAKERKMNFRYVSLLRWRWTQFKNPWICNKPSQWIRELWLVTKDTQWSKVLRGLNRLKPNKFHLHSKQSTLTVIIRECNSTYHNVENGICNIDSIGVPSSDQHNEHVQWNQISDEHIATPCCHHVEVGQTTRTTPQDGPALVLVLSSVGCGRYPVLTALVQRKKVITNANIATPSLSYDPATLREI